MHSEFRFRNFQILDISDVIKIYKTQKNENTNFQFYRFLKCCRLTKPKRERDQKDWICDRNNGFASKKNLNRLSLKKITLKKKWRGGYWRRGRNSGTGSSRRGTFYRKWTDFDRWRAADEKNKTRKNNFIFSEEINNCRKNFVIDPNFQTFLIRNDTVFILTILNA